MQKQNRNKKGQYGQKTWRVRLNNRNMLVAILWANFGFWGFAAVQIVYLPSNTLTIIGSSSRLEVGQMPDTTLSETLEPTDDGSGVTNLENKEVLTEKTSTGQASSIEEKIKKEFGENAKIMLAIAKAESGLKSVISKPNKNGTRDVGIFQINDCHGYSVEERLDPEKNIQMAKKVFEKQGFLAWSVYKNKSYLKYL